MFRIMFDFETVDVCTTLEQAKARALDLIGEEAFSGNWVIEDEQEKLVYDFGFIHGSMF